MRNSQTINASSRLCVWPFYVHKKGNGGAGESMLITCSFLSAVIPSTKLMTISIYDHCLHYDMFGGHFCSCVRGWICKCDTHITKVCPEFLCVQHIHHEPHSSRTVNVIKRQSMTLCTVDLHPHVTPELKSIEWGLQPIINSITTSHHSIAMLNRPSETTEGRKHCQKASGLSCQSTKS